MTCEPCQTAEKNPRSHALEAALTAERARSLFVYEPDSGLLRWRRDMSSRIKAGSVAGCHSTVGYIVITLGGYQYRAHRLIWLLVHGRWPDEQIDHKNGVRDDNRLVNLRQVSVSENAQNQRRGNGAVGLLGVVRSKQIGKYRAKIVVRGKTVMLGTYSDPEAAHAAYVAAKRQFHPAGML